MRKLILIITGLVLLGLSCPAECMPAIEDDISTNDYARYNFETGTWQKHIKEFKLTKHRVREEVLPEENDESIILTKRIYKSSSVYMNNKNKPVGKLHSDYEFLYDGKLIGVDNNNLKYYEVGFKDGKMTQRGLSEEELSEIFPDAKIVKISEFKNGEYVFEKKIFEIARIVLLNDTEQEFYKYSYRPPKAQTTEVKGYVVSMKPGKIVYSHYGDSEGALKIIIKNVR